MWLMSSRSSGCMSKFVLRGTLFDKITFIWEDWMALVRVVWGWGMNDKLAMAENKNEYRMGNIKYELSLKNWEKEWKVWDRSWEIVMCMAYQFGF